MEVLSGHLLECVQAACPYCGESIELVLDCSPGTHRYIEDCQVCCRPMVVHVALDERGKTMVSVAHEDEVAIG